MAECHKCKRSIRGETGIACAGVCGKIYHCADKCAGLDQYSSKILEGNPYLRYMCDDCVQYIHNVDFALREIQDGVNKNKVNLVEYKNDFEMSLKQNENEIRQLLQAIEKRYEERFRKIDDAQKIVEKNVNEIKNLCGVVNDFEKKNKDIYNTIEENNEKMCNEIKKVIKETSDKQNKMSFADAVKKNTVLPNLKKQVPLIIKPKEKQKNVKTKEDLNNRVDPADLNITNIENRRNGTIVIQSENDEERQKIKNAIENKMSDTYEIKAPDENDMSIIITDMSFKYTEKEIIDKIKRQNQQLQKHEMKIVKSYEFKKYNKIIYNVKILVDKEAYIKIKEAQKLNIGWEKCRIFDGTDIIQCFKCFGYNHKAGECKNDEICYKCHENHKSKECNKEIINKCINCIRTNRRLNMGLDENHATSNKECPVYQNKLEMKKKRLGLIL